MVRRTATAVDVQLCDYNDSLRTICHAVLFIVADLKWGKKKKTNPNVGMCRYEGIGPSQVTRRRMRIQVLAFPFLVKPPSGYLACVMCACEHECEQHGRAFKNAVPIPICVEICKPWRIFIPFSGPQNTPKSWIQTSIYNLQSARNRIRLRLQKQRGLCSIPPHFLSVETILFLTSLLGSADGMTRDHEPRATNTRPEKVAVPIITNYL